MVSLDTLEGLLSHSSNEVFQLFRFVTYATFIDRLVKNFENGDGEHLKELAIFFFEVIFDNLY